MKNTLLGPTRSVSPTIQNGQRGSSSHHVSFQIQTLTQFMIFWFHPLYLTFQRLVLLRLSSHKISQAFSAATAKPLIRIICLVYVIRHGAIWGQMGMRYCDTVVIPNTIFNGFHPKRDTKRQIMMDPLNNKLYPHNLSSKFSSLNTQHTH